MSNPGFPLALTCDTSWKLANSAADKLRFANVGIQLNAIAHREKKHNQAS